MGTERQKSFLYPKEKGELGTERKNGCQYPKETEPMGTEKEKSFLYPKGKEKRVQEERKQDMVLFKSRYEKELDALMTKIDMNMSNNYKDNAQADFQELESRLTEMKEQGLLKEKSRVYYENRVSDYREKLKGYTHKDQKPYWT